MDPRPTAEPPRRIREERNDRSPSGF